MKLNLGPEIDREIAAIMEKFVQDGWTQEDLGFAWKEDQGLKMNLVVVPRILYYTADEKIPQAVIWHGLRFSWKGVSEEALGILSFAVVTKLRAMDLTPFHDEDAKLRGYWRKYEDTDAEQLGYVTYECFVNPSYPKGKWDNHTL